MYQSLFISIRLVIQMVSPTCFPFQFSSVQFSHSVLSDSLRPHELLHARPPCPSPTPGVNTHVHWVCDAIQPPRPLLSPSPPAFSLSHHQGFSFTNIIIINMLMYQSLAAFLMSFYTRFPAEESLSQWAWTFSKLLMIHISKLLYGKVYPI